MTAMAAVEQRDRNAGTQDRDLGLVMREREAAECHMRDGLQSAADDYEMEGRPDISTALHTLQRIEKRSDTSGAPWTLLGDR